MHDVAPRLLLVIPAYREAARLPVFLDALRAVFVPGDPAVELLVVDDGSPDEDWRALAAMLADHQGRQSPGGPILRPPLRLASNTRKGGAILAGWQEALREPGAETTGWLGFVDADGAVPASEVRRVWLETAARSRTDEAVFASRIGGPAGWVKRPWTRGASGRAFAALVRVALGLGVRDPQCGFKLVSADVVRRVAVRLGDGHGFCFDAALAVALREERVPVRETPIRWTEVARGGFRPSRHVPGMLRELWRIRRIQNSETPCLGEDRPAGW